ncbi:MAG TPA: phenylalanine--tRNA ligase subunit alpha [Verrucomicrobiae bacterium]|nr:phenylalanine--tRNA ligase subunit alpha [Verrucomicrobiae bacterium]
MDLRQKLTKLAEEARAAVRKAEAIEDLEQLDVQFLGRKGELTGLLKELAGVTPDERKVLGIMANETKNALERDISERRAVLRERAVAAALAGEREDVTEPGERPPQGHTHLVSQAIAEFTKIFEAAGFTRVRQPEVDWDWYAFEALNMPKDHPARDDWETFFMDVPVSEKKHEGKMILTPHTTNGTARLLAGQEPPIRAITIGKTYRRQIDLTHVPMFHQFDGVYLDKGVNLTHLIGIMDYFVKNFFGPERKIRIRPHHFRFTEPSFEIDISTDTRMGKNGWLELGGAGMLHPNVLKAAGIDPNVYSGLAFGWGVERTYMMKEGLQLDDIRTLYKNDLRFLQQF